MFGALAVGWFAAVAVAFVAGCIYAFVLANAGHTFEWPPADLVFGIGFISALTSVPIAVAVGLLVALPLFRYWVRRSPRPLVCSLVTGVLMSLAAALVVLVFNRSRSLVESDFKFALVTVAVAGPLSALTVWATARKTDGGVI